MNFKLIAGISAFAALLAATQATAAGGDPKAGQTVFAQCAACHKIDTTGKSGIGPNLNKVIGRTSGTLTGFKYSPAMVAAKRAWTEAALDAYLAAPAKAIPGNRMPYAGLKSAADRKNVIAYIKSASK
jgi:cytochrome c